MTVSTSPRVPILLYHRVVPDLHDRSIECYRLLQIAMSQATFERQMLHVRSNYRVMGLRAVVAALAAKSPLPDNACVITFDDSYSDHFQHAYPVLKKLGLVATFFIESGHTAESHEARVLDRFYYALDHTPCKTFALELPDGNRLDSQPLDAFSKITLLRESGLKGWLKQKDRATQLQIVAQIDDALEISADASRLSNELYLSIAQMEEMARGGMEFGAHTVHHPSLLHVDVETARREIFESGDFAKEINGTKPIAFAYPFGEGSNAPSIRRLVRDCGYYAACTTAAGFNHWDTSPFELRRLTMAEDTF